MNRHSNKALWSSVFLMGLGQFFNRQYLKAFLLFAVKIFALYYFIFLFPTHFVGLVTLGDKVQSTNELGETIQGDNSVFLMVYGLIAVIVALILIGIYIFNIFDALKNGKLIDNGEQTLGFWNELKIASSRQFPIFLLILPALGILFFTIFPLVFGILFAFTNYDFNHMPPGNLIDWTGIDTFKELIFLESYSYTFYNVALWTIVWAIIATVTTYFGGMFVAILIQQKGIRFKKFWRTVYILPYAIPQFISLLVWRSILNENFGPINVMFEKMGYTTLIPWLNDPMWAKLSIILVNMWIGIPVSMILITGILTTISKDLYEAADVDGANDFQKFRFITLPMILFSTAPILIMQFAGNINNFNVIYLLTDGGPAGDGFHPTAGSTDLLVTWLFKLSGLGSSGASPQYNLASAIGIIIFIVIATISIISFRRTKSFKESDMIQ
jgi:arabinogalactan oligomer/maltooligosaccharide transport system permease protein